MTRIKGGIVHAKKRRNVLKRVKGYKWGRKNKIKLAKIAEKKAGQHAYNDRKIKKRTNRGLWLIRINAAARKYDLSYSVLIDKLVKAKIKINRKMLSELASKHEPIFAKIVDNLK
ncbi:MAG: 50S ribosomal protein L20 [bacterium]